MACGQDDSPIMKFHELLLCDRAQRRSADNADLPNDPSWSMLTMVRRWLCAMPPSVVAEGYSA